MGNIHKVNPDGSLGEVLMEGVPEDADKEQVRAILEKEGKIQSRDWLTFMPEQPSDLPGGMTAPLTPVGPRESNFPPAPESPWAPEGAGKTLETVGGIGKVAAPMLAPFMFGPVGPAASTMLYAGGAAMQQAGKYLQGMPTDIPGALAETANVGASNWLANAIPAAESFKALRASPGVAGLVNVGGQAGASLGGNVLERYLKGQSLTPDTLEVGLAALFAVPAGYMKSALAGVNIREDKLNAARDLLKQRYAMSDADATAAAPFWLAGEDPEIWQDLEATLHERPEHLPGLVPRGERIGQQGLSELTSTPGATPLTQTDIAQTGAQVNRSLRGTLEDEITSGIDTLKARAAGGQPLPTADEQARAAQNLARTQALATQALRDTEVNMNDALVTAMANEYISRGGGATNIDELITASGGGSQRLGEVMQGTAKARWGTLKAQSTALYKKLAETLDQSPIQNAPVTGMGAQTLNDAKVELDQMVEALEKMGIPTVPARVRNAIEQLFPANGQPRSVRQVIEAIPALNAAQEAAKGAGKDAHKLGYRLGQIREQVFAALDEATQADPGVMEASRQARSAYARTADARTVSDRLGRMDPVSIGNLVMKAPFASGEASVWRKLAKVLKPADKQDTSGPLAMGQLMSLRQKTSIPLLVRDSIDPMTGKLDLMKLSSSIEKSRQQLDTPLYTTLKDLVEQARVSPADRNMLEMLGTKYAEGRLSTTILNDLDPTAVALGQSIAPKDTEVIRRAAIGRIIDSARTSDGIDPSKIFEHPAIRKLMDAGRMDEFAQVWPELADLSSGAGAAVLKSRADGVKTVKSIVDKFGIQNADTLQKIMLNNAELAPNDIKQFKALILSRPDGDVLWDKMRNSFWQDQLFDPKTGVLSPERWLSKENGWTGFTNDALAELAGAGKSGLSAEDALARVAKWDKLMRRLGAFSALFGNPNPQTGTIAKSLEKQGQFVMASIPTNMAVQNEGSTRWALFSTLKQWIATASAEMKATRLFDRRQDYLTDKLGEMLKQFSVLSEKVIQYGEQQEIKQSTELPPPLAR